MTTRRLVIRDPSNGVLHPRATIALRSEGRRFDEAELMADAAIIDVSGIPNANAGAPFVLTVEEYCDHEQWHEIGRVPLPNWADNEWSGQPRA